jgi:hypothetical protein|tara:strand:- start:40 stop:333 length:294 start_codon:yes stop_codon:yes gene_type:complete
MANFIKIKAADVNHADQTSDLLIGDIVSVMQGLANGNGDADKFTIYTASGKSILMTATGKGKEWANQVISACTANPGGVMSIVQNSTGVKITDVVIA